MNLDTVRTSNLSQLSADLFQPVDRREKAEALARPSLSYWADAWIRLRKNKQALTSLWIILSLVGFTLLGPMIWTTDPAEQSLGRISEKPSLGREVLVQPTLPAWESTLAPLPTGSLSPTLAAELAAPQNLHFLADPSPESVRLTWDVVPGAEAYALFRSDRKPTGPGDYGIPVIELDSPLKNRFEDKFDLKPGTIYYTVVPKKSGEEGPQGATLSAELKPTISVEAARKILPAAEPGSKISLPARPFGSDYLGRDLLARLMAGARVSLFIGFTAPLFSVLLGILIGGISGFFGGRVDQILMRLTDFVLALPFLLFMILFKVAFGAGAGESGVFPMLIAMIVLSWTGPARLTRGQVLQLRESEFVQAARLLGAKPGYLILRHLLPNTLGVILVSATFAIPSAIFTEAFLSFIGMGVVPPTPSWGSMCLDGVQTFLNTPHEFLIPAAFISITVLAFNLLGDGLRDALDPKMRSRS